MMDTEKRIEFTGPAKERLDVALAAYRAAIEAVIADENFVPGEAVVEATASDVEKAARRLVLVSHERDQLRSLVTALYLVMGILTIFAGLFYPTLEQIVRERPMQLAVILSGVFMVMAAVFLDYSYRRRQLRRIDSNEQRVEILNS